MARPAKKLHLECRKGSWRVTVKVPADCRAIIGKANLIRVLGKIPYSRAAALHDDIATEFKQRIADARGGTAAPEDDPIGPRFWHTPTPWSPFGHLAKSPPPENGGNWVWQEKTEPADTPVSFTEVLAIWKLENDNPDTFKKFTRMMGKLAAFVGHDDAKRITPRQIVGFETSLRQSGKLHPNTISNYMGAFNAVFKTAKRKFMIDTNPMADVKVPAKVDTDIKPYTPEQVRTIVTKAQKLRVELFLCAIVQAYTGIRISEIANRHTSDIRQVNGIWCLQIPNGKTKSSKRIIPLHPAVQKVLLPYLQSVIEQHGEGLLFPELPCGSSGKPSVYATRELCRWIRKDLEIVDEKVEPNHSYRHYVKSQLLKANVDVKIRDMICGHGANVARRYEHGEIEQMAEAIEKLPDPLGQSDVTPLPNALDSADLRAA
jgi:integrase